MGVAPRRTATRTYSSYPSLPPPPLPPPPPPKVICDLIENPRKGILAILDEKCLMVGRVNDTDFLEHMDRDFRRHEHYSSRQTDQSDRTLRHNMDFRLKHFAGNVTYTVEGFMDKVCLGGRGVISYFAFQLTLFLPQNRDLLFQDLKRLMYNCGCGGGLLKEIFPEGAQDINAVTRRPVTAGKTFKVRKKTAPASRALQSQGNKEEGSTHHQRFNDAESPLIFICSQTSMQALVEQLMLKSPFYVRCIKPNELKSPVKFDEDRCRHQVRYLGLLENVRVRRAGYATRMPFEYFLQRYKVTTKSTWPNYRGSTRDGVAEIVKHFRFIEATHHAEVHVR